MTQASEADRAWLSRAIDLSRLCPPSQTAFSVGAVIVDVGGNEISWGYSRESYPHFHAEETALAKLSSNDPRLGGATLYSSLEPCAKRHSRPQTCTQLILAAGIARVVIAWREPDLFVIGSQGTELLCQAGREVVELSEYAEPARAVNVHLLGMSGDPSGEK